MTWLGRVYNGVVLLPEDVHLPDGTPVEVSTVVEPTANADGAQDPVFRIADLAVATGIPDLETNIDHYLYGYPKVTDGD